MKSKDSELLAEAYISALQKTVNVPSDNVEARINPPTADIEGEAPAVSVAVEEPCDCDMHDESPEHEEAEEHWMVRSNLFSLYSNAKKIHNLAQMGLDLEPWAQQKIAVAAHDLEAVMKYVQYVAAEKGLSC